MPAKNYYHTLQVDPEAEPEVVQSAYRRLAQLYHPDVSKAPDAELRMRDLNEAWEVLRDPVTRRRYDERLRTQSSASPSGARQQETSGRAPDTQPSTGANDQGQGSEHAGATTGQSHAHVAQEPEPHFPVRCERCHASDPTLRICAFPYVISIVILTFRRTWGGVYCEHCRRVMMTRAKVLTMLLGWWGIPFGPIFSLGVLFRPSQGVVPTDSNAAYLAALGLHFLGQMRPQECAQALKLSLDYSYDDRVVELYRSIFSRRPPAVETPSHGTGGGILFGFSVVAAMAVAYFSTRSEGTWATLPLESRPTASASTSGRPSPASLVPTGWANAASLPAVLPLSDLEYYSSPAAHLRVKIPASYDVAYELRGADGSQATHMVFISSDWSLSPPDAVVYLWAIEPTAGSGRRVSSELRSDAEKRLLARVDTLTHWKALTDMTAVYQADGARAGISGTYTLSTGQQVFSMHAAVVTDTWVYYIDVLGTPDGERTVTQFYNAIVSSLTPYDG